MAPYALDKGTVTSAVDTLAAFRETFRSPILRRTVAVLAIILGLLAVGSRSTSLGAADLTRNDFTLDYASAKALLHGNDPYDSMSHLVHYLGANAPYYEPPEFDSRSVHPPFHIAIVTPLTALPYRVARIIWLLLMAGCSGLAVGMLIRTLGVSRRWSVVTGIGVLALPIFQKDLVYGQSNGLLLLLLVLAWHGLKKDSQRVAGLSLGIAAAVKLFPVLMVVPLIRERRWRALGWMVGTAAVLSAAGALAVGITASREFIKPATSANFAFWRAAPMNLSLPGVAYRWLTRSRWRPLGLNLPSVAAVLAFALIALCIVAMFKTPSRLSGRYWATMPLLLLATPLVWDNYLVLIAPILIAGVIGSSNRVLVMISLAVLAIGIPPGLPSPPPLVPDVAQVLGYALPTYALIVVAASEWRRDRAEPVYSV